MTLVRRIWEGSSEEEVMAMIGAGRNGGRLFRCWRGHSKCKRMMDLK